MSELTWRWCTDCAAETPFEAPPCQDGHDVLCPDLACTACGLAVTVGHQVDPAALPMLVAA